MDYIENYWAYASCYEIPRNYAFLSALGLLGATIHRKVFFLHGDIEVHCNLYILLVGPQGTSKSTVNDISSKIFRKVCPDYAIGASTQSAEDIVSVMSKDTFAKSFTNENSEQVLVSPYTFFINEFKDFIAYNPTRMLNFLTNIYDRKFFDSSTIKRGVENIVNPSLNLIACENPEQLTGFMKSSIVSGGFSRRVIIVNEDYDTIAKPFIVISPEIRAKEQEMIQRVADCKKVVGQFKWHPSGMRFYDKWYREKKASLPGITNALMKGYTSSKHIQLFKICMCLDCVSDKPMLLFTDDLLQRGLSFLDPLEKNMPKLSMAAGRNELAGPMMKVLETLENNDGWMEEKLCKRSIETELSPSEMFSVFRYMDEQRHFVRKQYLFPGSKEEVIMLVLPEKYERMKANGETKEIKKSG